MSTFVGTKISNKLFGTSSDDLFAGLAGNDTLDGQGGSDSAWYGGLLQNYTFGTFGGYLTVTDRNTADGDDGSDRLNSIEKLSFSNGTLQVTGGEFQVNATSTGEQTDSSVTALSDGGFIVMWTSNHEGVYSIYGQRYTADGLATGNEFHSSSVFTDYENFPSVTALSSGGFVATWTDGDDGSDYGIYGQRFAPDGSADGNAFVVNSTITNAQEYSKTAALTDGGFVVTWTSPAGQDGSYAGIFGRRYAADGTATGAEFQVNTYTTSYQRYSSVAALSNGGFVVTWMSDGQDGSASGIYGQSYMADGSKLGHEFRVNTYTTDEQLFPAAIGLSDGGFVVTWSSSGQDGSDDGIYGQRYDVNGVKSGSEFQVNTCTTGEQSFSSATALSDGGFVVTWQSYNQDGESSGIYGQRYAADGTASGNEFQVNTYTTNTQQSASVSALADGGFVVTWTSVGQDGDSAGIYGQRYAADGSPVGLKITGTASADVINIGDQTLLTVDGAAGNDTINGGNGDDILLGGLGSDKLTGNNGDDMLDGGVGSDVMIGGNGSDTYVVDSKSDVITEKGISGSDTVQSSITYTIGVGLENLTLTGSNDINATGNASGNVLTGNSGDNTLDGKAGGDLMIGASGNDKYIIDSLSDMVSENANQGNDKVMSAVSYTLGDYLENLALTGTAAIDGTGNSLSNIIDGNAAANMLAGDDGNDSLNGMAGNDALFGGNGNDVLSGGLGFDFLTGNGGNDTFRFDSALGAKNADLITDFVPGADTIELSLSVFAKLGGVGMLNASKFTTGTSFANTDSHNLLYNTTTGGLYYNADGAGSGALALIATLDNHASLTAIDFRLA